MHLPFLKKEYLPTNTTSPQYDAVYNAILTYQAKNDKTARCYLASPTSTDPKDISRFSSRLMEDPMEDMPFDIMIDPARHHASLTFTEHELSSFEAPEAIPEGPGISGEMELADSHHCGIQSASGVFKIKRVWTKPNPDVDGGFVELFEGFLSFDVSYSGLYRRKGHGIGNNVEFAFWGVRARTDKDGKEIGLCPMIPVSASGEQVGDGVTSEVFFVADISGMLKSPGLPPSEIRKFRSGGPGEEDRSEVYMAIRVAVCIPLSLN